MTFQPPQIVRSNIEVLLKEFAPAQHKEVIKHDYEQLFGQCPTEDDMLAQPNFQKKDILIGKHRFGIETEQKAVLRELDRLSLQEYAEDQRYNQTLFDQEGLARIMQSNHDRLHGIEPKKPEPSIEVKPKRKTENPAVKTTP